MFTIGPCYRNIVKAIRFGNHSHIQRDTIACTHGTTIVELSANPQDAEEASQDVFVKVYEGLSKFRGEAAIRTWIYRVAINTCLDHIKARKRKKRSFLGIIGFVDDHVDRLTSSEFDHPGVALEDREATAKVLSISINFQRNNAQPCYLKPQREWAKWRSLK